MFLCVFVSVCLCVIVALGVSPHTYCLCSPFMLSADKSPQSRSETCSRPVLGSADPPALPARVINRSPLHHTVSLFQLRVSTSLPHGRRHVLVTEREDPRARRQVSCGPDRGSPGAGGGLLPLMLGVRWQQNLIAETWNRRCNSYPAMKGRPAADSHTEKQRAQWLDRVPHRTQVSCLGLMAARTLRGLIGYGYSSP